MLSLRQKEIEEYIDMHCANFPFPSGVEELFTEEELEYNATIAESARNLLKEVNKVKHSIYERISAKQFVEYYNTLMTEVYGESIVSKLEQKLESMKLDSYEKSQMILFKEKIEAQLEAREGKILRDKLQEILDRKPRI